MQTIAQNSPPLERGIEPAAAPDAQPDAKGQIRRARLRLLVAIPAATVVWVLAVGVLGVEVLQELEPDLASPRFDGFRIALVAGVLLITALAALTGIALSRSVLSPISRLEQELDALASGKPAREIRVPPGNEIGNLGKKFNTMLHAIQALAQEHSEAIMEHFAGAEGLVTALNSEAARLLGATPEGVRGQSLNSLLGGSDVNAELVREVQRLFDTGVAIENRPMIMTGADGDQRPTAVTASVRRGPDGEIREAVFNLRDIGKMREFHERMKRSEQLTAVSTFASGVAHEIRNPLASIKAIAQLLCERREREGESPWERHLTVILDQAERLEQIMGGLDAFNHMASSTKIPCDLNALLNEALVLARHRLAGDPASEVVVHSELEPLPRISGEPDRLMQALFHIVTNALEATADDGEVWIRTRAQSSPAGAILEVENSGTTIPAADRDRIFTPFYTTKAAGPGLGLAVARQIMDQHRGGITVSGARGRTTFTLTFPARCGDATSPHGVATSEMGARV